MKKVTHYIFIILVSGFCSCRTNHAKIIDAKKDRIDSVLKWAVNDKNFPYKYRYKGLDSLPTINYKNKIDTVSYQDILLLYKRIYYPQFDITLEFRQGDDCHDLIEYIICYDSLNISVIRLTDNLLFYVSKGDTSKYKEYLCFEKDINRTLQIFNYKQFSSKHDQVTVFPHFLLYSIFEQSTKFTYKEILLDELYEIKENTLKSINESDYYFTDRKNCNPGEKIDKLIYRHKNGQKATLIYMPENLLIYEIIYDSKKNRFEIDYINEECYFDIIF